jgi:aminocarboxymuconate-semialdehyde decarboxylase
MGEERVMLGSDYPYPLGERPVGQVVRKAEFLTAAQREKLLGGNALEFLGDHRRPLDSQS